MPPIRFVYFDLDDTLLDHRLAERRALADLCDTFPDAFAAIPLEHVQDQYHAHNVVLWKQYSLGEIQKTDLRRLRFEWVLRDLCIDALGAEEAGGCYMDCYRRHWAFIEGAREAFHAVADRHPVGILTNGFAEVQHAKLDQFPELRDRAAALVISEEIGYMKPHPRLFAHAAEVAGVPPKTILYVGDSLHSDVEGGLGAGWQVAWYRRNGHPEQQTKAFRFDAWPNLLRRLGIG